MILESRGVSAYSIEGENNRELEEKIVKQDHDNFEKTRIRIDSSFPSVSYMILAINVAVWIIMSTVGMLFDLNITYQLLLFGAKFNELIADGQYWRLLTSMFLHVNLIHLFFNSFALYIYGPVVEKLYGKRKFLIIYILAGLIGSLLSFMFNPHPAAGASGAIFGLMGAILYLRQHRRKFFQRIFGPGLMIIIIINLVYGLTQPGIDNWAHMGGLAGGFAIANALGLYKEGNNSSRKFMIWGAVVALFIFGILYGQNKYS